VVRLGRTADATINGRHLAAAASAVAAVLLLFAPGARAVGPGAPAFVPQELLDAAAANPAQIFRVIVQGTPSQPVTTVEAGVEQTMTNAPATGDSVTGAFSSIGAVAAELTGEQIELLSADPGVLAITPDMPLRASVTDPPGSGSTNSGSGSTNSGSISGTSTSTSSTSTSTSTSSTSTSTSTTSTNVSTLTSPNVPTNVTPPIIVGNPVVGATLWASHGTWSNVDHPDYDWSWQRCNVVTALCTPINNWSRWYTPGNADVGSTLQVVVTVSDNGSRASATSSQTDRVAPYSPSGFFNWQLGPYAANVDSQWTALATAAANPPAIAVVDSGVDPTLPGLDGSVVDQEVLTSLPQSTAADGYGHGSFVAQVAAGRARGDAGASPTARIVSLDVMDDHGMALTSDVVAAADWIYTHKDANNIRVANFSLIGGSPSSIMFDPLDRALERLWFSGVVVVTAAGNFAVEGQQSDEPFAPANDPFVITVGASDTAGTVATTDDSAAPWSAYGHTLDGFAKPELSAPGRYVIESVPTDSTLYQERPDRVVEPGKIELSGTSFAAPMVSGIAANLLAFHPTWTPDQVKGALMLTAAQPTSATGYALGVGVVNADAAAGVADPPNPNAALDQFVVPDPNDAATKVFDTASWGTTAQADASWGTASWGTASWGTASWGTASWGTTYWSSASWGTASWGTASWGTASWGTASWGTDNALSDLLPGGYPMNFG
jgi:serine protease AprX